jgi:hypothetical protein
VNNRGQATLCRKSVKLNEMGRPRLSICPVDSALVRCSSLITAMDRDIAELLDEVKPSTRGSEREIHRALVVALLRRSPDELRALAERFQRAECYEVARICLAIAAERHGATALGTTLH